MATNSHNGIAKEEQLSEELELSDGVFSDSESEDDNPNVFRIRGRINPPESKTLSALELHAKIHEGQIDVNPKYQREVVWPETKQMHLIDSIFRGFYIPPVIFAIHEDEDGDEQWVCVDGKQRLTSIHRFLDGQIPHKDPKTKKKFWYSRSKDSKKLGIPDQWKRKFEKTNVTCVQFRGLAHTMEHEIFKRVQEGMPLKAAEKLRAIEAPWADWIADLEAKYVSCEQGLAELLDWNVKRGRDFQCVAQLVYGCDNVTEQLTPLDERLRIWLAREDAPLQGFKDDMVAVLGAFCHIANPQNQLNHGFTNIPKKVAPVEFVFIGVLLYVMRRFEYQYRADAIYGMRRHVRAKHVDIRTNEKVSATLWQYISAVGRVKGVPDEHDLAAEPLQNTRKRRNAFPQGAPDDEYHPSPVKGLGKPMGTRAKPKKARTS